MPKQAINYQNTIIYKIVCKDLSIKDLYVGHTTSFKHRKKQHKESCSNPASNAYNFRVYDFIRKNGDWNDWDMIEVEKYPCKDKNEATARERYWYEELKGTLNMVYPKRTQEERYEINKEHILEKAKERYEEKKEEILEKVKHYNQKHREEKRQYLKKYYQKNKDERKEKIECPCGSSVRKDGLSDHLKTNKHQEWQKSTK
jgi:hypothetical protein